MAPLTCKGLNVAIRSISKLNLPVAENAQGCQLGIRQILNLHIFLCQNQQRSNIALSKQASIKITQISTSLLHLVQWSTSIF